MRDEFETPLLFDAHVHLRDGDVLRKVAPWTAAYCGEAVVMPNVPAVDTGGKAVEYRAAIERATEGLGFTPLMTMKLTQRTTPEDILCAFDCGVVACKVYPEGVTTGSNDGVKDLAALDPALAAMSDLGLVLCVHGEKPDTFVLDREAAYLPVVERVLAAVPGLRVVLEHVTTEAAVRFVERGPARLAATVTAHHLELTLDDVLGDGIRPHLFCYPVAKTPRDRGFLLGAAVESGCPRFFLGSDSAPHRRRDKESACGCAGVYTAPVLPSVLAEVFFARARWVSDEESLARFVGFCCTRGPAFYRRELAPGRLAFRHPTEAFLPLSAATAEASPDSVAVYGAGRKFSSEARRVTAGACGGAESRQVPQPEAQPDGSQEG